MRRTAYWLSTQGEGPSGPFTIAQLQGLWSIGQITFSAQVMQEGDPNEHWRPAADVVLPWKSLEPRAREKKRGTLLALLGLGIAALAIWAVTTFADDIGLGGVPRQYREEIAAVKGWIHSHATDPKSVSFHGVGAAESGDMCVVTVDFSQTNADGWPRNEHWTFTLDKHTLAMETVVSRAEGLLHQSPAHLDRLKEARRLAERARSWASNAEAAAQTQAEAVLAGAGDKVPALPTLPGEPAPAGMVPQRFHVNENVQHALEEAGLAPPVAPGEEVPVVVAPPP